MMWRTAPRQRPKDFGSTTGTRASGEDPCLEPVACCGPRTVHARGGGGREGRYRHMANPQPACPLPDHLRVGSSPARTCPLDLMSQKSPQSACPRELALFED